MSDTLLAALETLGEHVGAAVWGVAVFACGFLLAFPVVKLGIRSLLVFPMWLLRLARKYLKPEVNAVWLCAFIFAFNTVAIFCYMVSGGLVVLPIVFDLFTGLNIGVIMLKDAEETLVEPRDDLPVTPRPRAWIGFLSLFVVMAELTSFWLAIGMGIKLGHEMQADFGWATFVRALGPRMLAYAVILVPALAASAVAETAAIKGMMHRGPDEGGGAP